MKQPIRRLETLSFAALSFGQSLIGVFVSSYILYFFTDVALLPATTVSWILLVGRLFDGGVDPVIGYYMDKRAPKEGKFKGYLAKWTPLLFVFSVLLFAPFPFEARSSVLICFAFYILWSFSYSMVENVSGALSISLSAITAERRRLNTVRIISSVAVTLIVSYSALYLVDFLGEGNEETGFFFTAILFSAVSVAAILPSIRLLHERNYKETNRLKLQECLLLLAKNKKLLFFLLMYACNQIASTFKTQTVIYYFKYSFDRMDLVPIFYLLGRFASLAAQPAILFLAKRYKLQHLMVMGYIVSGLITLSLFLLQFSPWNLIVLCSISSLFSAFPANLAFTYSAEIADGISQSSDNSFSGLVSSLTGLSSKVGSAIASSAAAFVLGLTTYVPNAAQSQRALLGIQICFIGCTSVMYLCSGAFAFLSGRVKQPATKGE